MKNIALMSILFGCFLVSGAAAGADIPAVCNAALASGIRDNYYVLTERQQFEMYQRRLCDAHFSSYKDFRLAVSKVKLDIPVAETLIPLSGSLHAKSQHFQEAYSRFCAATYDDSGYRDRFASYTSRVSAGLSESWLECQKTYLNVWLKINEKGIFIAVTPQDNFVDFTVSVYRKGNVDLSPVKINGISPARTVACARSGEAFGAGASVDQNEFQFTCSKPANRQISMAIDTTDGVSNTVKIPASISKLSELKSQISQQIQVLKDQIFEESQTARDMLNAGLKNERNQARHDLAHLKFIKACADVEANDCKPRALVRCPSGWITTGVWIDNSWNGGQCGHGSVCRLCYQLP